MRVIGKKVRDIGLVLPAVDEGSIAISKAINEAKKRREYDESIDAKIKSAASWEFKLSKTFSL